MVSIPIGRWKDWLEDYFSLFCFDERKKKIKNKKIVIRAPISSIFEFSIQSGIGICYRNIYIYIYISEDTLR